MPPALDLLEEAGDAVERDARPQPPEIARFDSKHRLRPDRPVGEAPPQDIVHDVTKGPARASHLDFQLGRHVVVQRQGRPHITMLALRHHDVNTETS